MATVPPELRDPSDPGAWPRRHLKLNGHDLLGDSEEGDEYGRGVGAVPLQMCVVRMLRALSRHLSVDQFGKDDRVSLSAALDLAVRWFIQHPPLPEWQLGAIAKWMFEHRRGRPSSKWITPIEHEAAANGESIKQAQARRRAIRDGQLRKLLTVMQERDLNADEVSGGVDLDWVKTGKLVIPKAVAQLVAAGNSRHEEVTPLLPFSRETQ